MVVSNFLAGDIEGKEQVMPLNFNDSTTVTLPLPIENDEVVEEDGIVSVQLLENATVYSIIADEYDAICSGDGAR